MLGKWKTTDSLADLNSDGNVNVLDLSRLLSKWGPVGSGGWQLYWSDEFNGTAVDLTRWGVYDPEFGNGRYGDADPGFVGCNTAKNVSVENGSLYIRSKKEQVICNNGVTTDYSAGFIGSRDTTPQKRYYPLYGRYEMRARIPHGQGIWPSFWLRHFNKASSAEVDILEVFHNSDPGSVTQSLHFPLTLGENTAKKGTPFEVPVVGTGGWHNFAVDIEQVYAGRNDTVKFTFWVNNTKTLEYTNTNATQWAGLADESQGWDIALGSGAGGSWVGHPDTGLGWGIAKGGICLLERPQRETTDSSSCAKERTAGRWYNDTLTKAPSPDGVNDIWLAPWNYGQPSADYIIDYIRVYTK
jgi:hypothetical protein